MTQAQALARRLGTGDAVVIGLGSMIGAGVFSAFAPAALAAGSALLVGLAVAAAVAYCNAVASAQLAAQYPTSGGTYVYGRERLGEWWGFTAGWGFVVGKTASCAAMALTFASYAVNGSEWVVRLVAFAAVVALTAANYRGISRTAMLARLLVGVSIAALLVAVCAIAAHGGEGAGEDGLTSFGHGGVYGVLQAAGLLFFAFAGYARIATLGEEVREPERTIPRAIPLALGITIGLYLLVGVALLVALGPSALAASPRPLAAAVDVVGAAWATPVVRVGAAVASLGALLALIAGVGRTGLAMARNGDLPRWLDSVHPTYRVPDHAELVVAAVVSVLVLTTDLRGAIGFSSFGVLTYYAIANASAFTQDGAHRRWPRTLNLAGLVGCAVLVVTLPWTAVVAGVGVFAVGLGGRLVLRGAMSFARRVGPLPDVRPGDERSDDEQASQRQAHGRRSEEGRRLTAASAYDALVESTAVTPAFEELESYRRELLAYSYRMLGSPFEAEDAVQETLIRAWRSADRFEGRAAVRSWLYRIATNVCLDQLKGRERRARPMDLGPAVAPAIENLNERSEVTWIEPTPDPADTVVERESIRLAFVAALQHLPPRQRAVLILCEVLRWQASEAAELLETSVASVNSALQRARATLAAEAVSVNDPAPELGDAERELLARFVDAFEAYDIDRLTALIHEDATQSMPPYDLWLAGRDDIFTWWFGPGIGCKGSRVIPTVSANGSPAFGQYKPSEDGGHEPWALIVLELSDGRIEELTFFLDTERLFPLFGLPPRLDA